MWMSNKISMFFIVTTLILLHNIDNAESVEAPSPGVDCSSVIANMANCLTFVREGSQVLKPEGGCCSGLKMVLKTDPECLCEGLKASGDFGLELNFTKALTLPSACHLPVPRLTGCGIDQLSPSAAPSSSPSSNDAHESAPAAAPSNSDTSAFTISLVFIILINLLTTSLSFL